jgi:hypothetical protein
VEHGDTLQKLLAGQGRLAHSQELMRKDQLTMLRSIHLLQTASPAWPTT